MRSETVRSSLGRSFPQVPYFIAWLDFGYILNVPFSASFSSPQSQIVQASDSN